MKTSSVAVVDYENGRKILACASSSGIATHSENLLPSVDFVLKSAGVSLEDVNAFGVVSGPGSFTGIRIGVATVKALAFGKEKSCIPVSPLDSLAEGCFAYLKDMSGCVFGTEGKILISPCIDARRKQVYNALYEYEANAEGMKKIKPDRIITCAEFEGELSERVEGDTVAFCGDGADLCVREIDSQMKKIKVELSHVSAVYVCDVAFKEYNAGGAINPSELLPEYLLKTQAEREYTEKNL